MKRETKRCWLGCRMVTQRLSLSDTCYTRDSMTVQGMFNKNLFCVCVTDLWISVSSLRLPTTHCFSLLCVSPESHQPLFELFWFHSSACLFSKAVSTCLTSALNRFARLLLCAHANAACGSGGEVCITKYFVFGYLHPAHAPNNRLLIKCVNLPLLLFCLLSAPPYFSAALCWGTVGNIAKYTHGAARGNRRSHLEFEEELKV